MHLQPATRPLKLAAFAGAKALTNGADEGHLELDQMTMFVPG